MAWVVQSVRCVAYTSGDGSQLDAEQVWKAALPQAAPETVNRPRTSFAQTAAAGEVYPFRHNVTVQPGRVDLIFSSMEDAITGRPPPANVALEQARTMMNAALEIVRATRVALVLDVISQASDEAAAQRQLHAELPFLQFPEGSREVNFQLNVVRQFQRDRPREMYRLCRWGAAVIQLFNLPILLGASMPRIPQSGAALELRHVLLYQMDVSSSPQSNLLDAGLARNLFGELVDEVGVLLRDGFKRFEQ